MPHSFPTRLSTYFPAYLLPGVRPRQRAVAPGDLRCPARLRHAVRPPRAGGAEEVPLVDARPSRQLLRAIRILMDKLPAPVYSSCQSDGRRRRGARSEEHTSELQSLMRITYAVFCLKTKTATYTAH